jgi:CheY-like chemotaxis protein
MTVQEFEIKNKIVSYLRKHESGASASEISKDIGHNRITVGKYLQVLKAESIVTSKKIASAIYWQLADYTKKSRVLIVDDEKHIVDLIRLSLSSGRYDLYEAYDGKEALAMVSKIVPDLIILDLMMPQVDGFEVARQLKENVLTQNIPIIILSAKSEVNEKAKLLDMGVDDYITKPFDPLELEARISNKLRKKQVLYSQNPLTGLPSTIVTQETKSLWEQKKEWYEIKLEINNFDDFTRVFGHRKGYEVVQLFSRLLVSLVHEFDPVFVGHISDFTFSVLSEKKLSGFEERIKKRFSQMLPFFYPEYADSLVSDPLRIVVKQSGENVDHSVISLCYEEMIHGK